MKKQTIMALTMTAFLAFPLLAEPPARQVNPDAKLHKFSTVVEKERPELDEETKLLIAE